MIARVHPSWLVALVLAGLASPTVAPVRAQSVRVYTEVDSIAVGERLPLVVAVDQGAAAGTEVTFPAIPPDTMGGTLRFGDLLLLDVVAYGSQQRPGGNQTDSVIYEATTFELDTARVGSIPVLLTAGPDTLIVNTDPFLIRVRSVVPSDAEDIMDLMPIAEFRPPIWPWLIFVAALLAAMAAFIYWYRRSGPEIILERETKKPVPPHEEALTRLTALDEVPVDSDAAAEHFCVELADILRTYLWRRASVHSLEMTTGELVTRLAAMEESRHIADGIAADSETVLHMCDLAKFAEIFPSEDRCRNGVDIVRALVLRLEEYYAPPPEIIATEKDGDDDAPRPPDADELRTEVDGDKNTTVPASAGGTSRPEGP